MSARSWRFDTGCAERDTMRRRYWSTGVLADLARAAHFEITPTPTTGISLNTVRLR